MTFNQITHLNPSVIGDKRNPESPNSACTVAVAGAADEAVLETVESALPAGVGFILFGEARSIRTLAARNGLDITGAVIRDIRGEEHERSDEELCVQAVRACVEGDAAVLMKGMVSTAVFTRAILDKSSGLAPPGSLLSHVGLFADPRIGNEQDFFLLTDAAINISPNPDDKKRILQNAYRVSIAIGIPEPRIALLAAVEKVNKKIPSTTDAQILKEWVNTGALGNSLADGPFALDVAASAAAARKKGMVDTVAGRVNIYLVPDLDAGNILYKSLTVFAGARSAGILAGAAVPVVLTSRSDSRDTRLASLAFALTVQGA